MTKDFKEILKAVSEDDVAACRKNNKRIKTTEDIEIRNLLAGDYWKFIYTAKHVHKNHYEFINTNRNNLEMLSCYIDEEYFTLRCIINALVCKLSGAAATYPLETLSEKERRAALELLIFSCKFGYYFWDIGSVCSSTDILNFFCNNGAMPSPPLPYYSNNEQMARIATYKMAIGTLFIGKESFIEEMKNNKPKFEIASQFHDDNFEKKIKQIRLQSKIGDITIEQMLDGDPRPIEEVADLIKMRKPIVPDCFHPNSIPARCIGLILYDSMVSLDEKCDDIVGRFKASDKYKDLERVRLFKKSDNTYISDKDNSTLKRWLKTTQNCVEKMAVLSFQ
jgi:hypothetical protein